MGLGVGGVVRGKKSRALSGEKSIGGDAECRVMMESSPTSAFEMVDANFVFEFLVIAFDAPAHMEGLDQRFQRCCRRQGAQMVFGGRRFVGWPFDDEPFLGSQC